MTRFPIRTSVLVMPLFLLATIIFAACNSVGPTDPSSRILESALSGLQVTPSSLDFGKFATDILLKVENNTSASFDWTAWPSKGWLSLPRSGRLAPGQSQVVTVTASRSKLSESGLYQASIRFESIAGNVSVPVTIRVPPPQDLNAIDATGTSDVTNSLNAYLASVPDGSVVRLPAGARYRVEGTVLLPRRVNLTIEGNGALIFATTNGSGVTPPPGQINDWPRNRYHVEIRGGSGIVIRNLNVRGANPHAGMDDAAYVSALEAQHAFAIHSATNVELDHVRATDVYGDFVYIGGGYGEAWNQNIRIHDSHFERNGRQGIAVTRGRGVLIERNYINDTRRATFDLEPSSEEGGALDVVIRDNEIGQGRLMFLASHGRGPNISFTVENNTLHRVMNIAVKTDPEYQRGPIRVVGNTSDATMGSPNAGLLFQRVDGVVVRNNYQRMQEWRGQTFAMACEASAVDIRDNDVPGAGKEFEVLEVCLAGGE